METAPEHASGVRYPQNARLRCWANAAATHAPSLRTACLYGRTHSDARAHTHPRKKTHTRTHSSTETHALVRVWTAKWMSSQHNPALQEWFSMLPDAQMCKWNRVTHFNRGGGGGARPRACVRMQLSKFWGGRPSKHGDTCKIWMNKIRQYSGGNHEVISLFLKRKLALHVSWFSGVLTHCLLLWV